MTGPFTTIKVAANRFNVIDTRTGKVVTVAPKTKYMASIEAKGRNLIHAQGGWCAALRYESEYAPAIVCGATVHNGVCPRARAHVNA